MEGNSTCQKRVCAVCNKEINCPEECFVVEDGTKPSNSYNKQFVYICRDCYEKSKKYTFTQEQLDQHDEKVRKQIIYEFCNKIGLNKKTSKKGTAYCLHYDDIKNILKEMSEKSKYSFKFESGIKIKGLEPSEYPEIDFDKL